MNSVVRELQGECLNRSLPLTDLLRKSYYIATKLNIHDFKNWIKKELDGYDSSEQVPTYRQARAELKAFNPTLGNWIPFVIPNKEFEDRFIKINISQPISEIEKLKQTDSKHGGLKVSFTGEQIHYLQNISHCSFRIERFLSETIMDKICDSVRTVILEWSMELEKQAILGENLSFTKDEKNIADNNPPINIQNFQGVLGNVVNSQLEQNLNFHINKGDDEKLKEILRKNQISEDDIRELAESIKSNQLPNESKNFGTKVNTWLGKMIEKAANGTWKISVDVAANLLTKAIFQYYGIN